MPLPFAQLFIGFGIRSRSSWHPASAEIGLCVWLTILLASASAVLLAVFEPVTWALMAELAVESCATANGMLATSNQLGAMIGASVGGG